MYLSSFPFQIFLQIYHIPFRSFLCSKWHITIDHLTVTYISHMETFLPELLSSCSKPDILSLGLSSWSWDMSFLHSGAFVHYFCVSWPLLLGSYVPCLCVISSFTGEHYIITFKVWLHGWKLYEFRYIKIFNFSKFIN